MVNELEKINKEAVITPYDYHIFQTIRCITFLQNIIQNSPASYGLKQLRYPHVLDNYWWLTHEGTGTKLKWIAPMLLVSNKFPSNMQS
jgi:hypothetical protein